MAIKKFTLIYLQGLFYILAGLNHFLNPTFYLPLIPNYLPWHSFINYTSGSLEVILGLGLLISSSRRISAYGVMLLLLSFIPAHWYFIQIGSCIEGGLCTPVWIAWVRLVMIHPLLLFWAWKARN